MLKNETNKMRVRKIIICKECKQKKPHVAFGLCRSCYGKLHHKTYIKPSNKIICKICKEEKQLGAHGLCTNCYKRLWKGYITKEGIKIVNSNSPTYLGVHVAEQVLSKVFKNVKQMPNGNPGYDFICSKGMKVDVKSSVFKFDKRRPNDKGRWHFNIYKNIIADYFLCIAFDNRSDLIPQHLWLIPSEKVNHLIGLSISKLQIHKWEMYSQPIDKVISCCNELKLH